MKITGSVKTLQKHLKEFSEKPLGFVPTMGALHEGHLSLVSEAISKCPIVVVSIYVNPAQFNDANDLKNYPRPIESDIAMLRRILRKNDLIFTPDDREIYPVEDDREFNFGNIDNVMEALHRPGHFNGVARVVSRLFDIVTPDIAFFGLKDFQQVAVINNLVKQLRYKVIISVLPIIREPDGLAMSSRNRLLDPELRKKTPVIYKTISEASLMIPRKDVFEIKKYVKDTIEKIEGFRVEYFEIVDDKELQPLNSYLSMKTGNHYYCCIAVIAGNIRLIDNIELGVVTNKKG